MKVAHIITRMIVGGAQENTLFTCLDLQRLHGDDVLLITGPALGPEGDLMQKMAGAGEVRTHEIRALRRAIHPAHDWQSYFAIKRALRTYQPDVVHTHSAKGGILGRLAAHALRVPAIVHTVHGAPFHPYQGRGARWFYQACERYAARKCHAIISVADAMTDLMVNANISPRDKFTTIYSGMNVEPFLHANDQRAQVRAELGVRDEHVVIGKIARLFELKGHEYVIEAAKELVPRHPHVRFLFVGDGIWRQKFESQIAAAGLSSHFIFTGLVPPARIPALLGAMDILVHCSLREGLARALPQALLAGKPAVSFDVDGAREVVIDRVTGRLLPACEVPPLVAALDELIANPNLREQLGQEGRRRCEQPFRHEVMTSQIRALYLQVLGQGG